MRLSFGATDAALAIAGLAQFGNVILRPYLRDQVKQRYSKTLDLAAKPYMVEALCVWWADLTSLLVGTVTTLGAAAFGQDQRYVSGVVCLLFGAATLEAIAKSPFDYEATCFTQRAFGLFRRRLGRKPPSKVVMTPAALLGVIAALAAIGSHLVTSPQPCDTEHSRTRRFPGFVLVLDMPANPHVTAACVKQD